MPDRGGENHASEQAGENYRDDPGRADVKSQRPDEDI